MFAFSTILHESNMSVCFGALSGSSHPCKYWGVKREDTSPLGPLFCHDFLLSLWEINGPCFSPPEEVFIHALLFSTSLLGPVVPRRHVRTNYTPARHCSVPHKGFALSGRVPVITVRETSNISPVASDSVWCIVMLHTLWAPETLGVSL